MTPFTSFTGIVCGLGLISLLAGCLDTSTVVYVKKDGSGTVTEKVMVTDELAAWTGTNQTGPTFACNRNRLKDKAAAMGRDVNLESVEELREKGMTGFRAVYAFRDVRNLAIDQQPDFAILGNLAPKQASRSRPVTFGFDETGSPTLVVNIPKPRAEDDVPLQASPPPIPRNLIAQQRAVIRTMFAKFRIRLLVKVQGTITGTHASHVEPGDRNTVVLLDLDVGKLVKDDLQLDKLMAMGRIDDIDTVRRRLVGMPGMKVENAERIGIEFE